jgi:DNA-binding MltR family transcriptional regulator
MAKRRSKNEDLSWIQAHDRLVERFHQDSDRAAGLLAATFLDSFLEDVLRSLLTPGKRTDELLDHRGALGTFSSRIDLAFALGIANEDVVADLTLIRKIRNHFAHDLWRATFQEQQVQDWIKALSFYSVMVDGDPPDQHLSNRDAYLICITYLVMKIIESPKVGAEFRQRFSTGVPSS